MVSASGLGVKASQAQAGKPQLSQADPGRVQMHSRSHSVMDSKKGSAVHLQGSVAAIAAPAREPSN